MPLIINTRHAPGRSIRDIYQELIDDPHGTSLYQEIGISMLRFIEMLDGIFKTTSIWALTSHYELVLQTQDDWKADWLVKIKALGNEYYIEYLMPEKNKPWPYAYVKGNARGIDDATKYLLIAMKECDAWEGNTELANALKQLT